MPISQSVLGMNARNFLYIRPFNRKKYKLIADDKLRTKKHLLKNEVPTPELLAEFHSLQQVRTFDWASLPEQFVIKPARGYGGQGITVVRNWNGTEGRDTKGHTIGIDLLESVVFEIIDGAHSLKNLPDRALIEDYVQSHTFFKKYVESGVPDIRVIVFHGIPVMAMLRLPTAASHGKANLHSGALGVGVDMRTGITTYGVMNGDFVSHIPYKKTKVHGIKVPEWERILLTAVRSQISSKLGFAGVDLVLDQERGPLVLEINARPGLSIQMANRDSLRTRLERVAHLNISDPQKGVDLARRLFADQALESVEAADKILGVIEKVVIYGNHKRKTVRAKIDTGAFRTSIDADLVHELGLDKHHKTVFVKSGSGEQKRRTVKLRLKLKDKEIKTIATYTERSHLRFPIIIGRRDIKEFMVDPAKIPEGITVR